MLFTLCNVIVCLQLDVHCCVHVSVLMQSHVDVLFLRVGVPLVPHYIHRCVYTISISHVTMGLCLSTSAPHLYIICGWNDGLNEYVKTITQRCNFKSNQDIHESLCNLLYRTPNYIHNHASMPARIIATHASMPARSARTGQHVGNEHARSLDKNWETLWALAFKSELDT